MRLKWKVAFLCVTMLVYMSSLSWALPIVSVDTDPGTAGIQNSLTVNPGDTFSVDIVITGLTTETVQFFEFDLGFDNTVLSATSVASGGFLTGLFGQASSPFVNTNAPEVEFDLLAFGPPTNTASSPLASIAFQVLGTATPGASLLDLNDVKLTQPGFPITLIPQGAPADGTITVSGGGPAPIPEPTSFLLLGTGLVGLAGYRWIRRTR